MNVRRWSEKYLLTLMTKRWNLSTFFFFVVPAVKVSAVSEVAREAFGQGSTNFSRSWEPSQKSG